MRAIHRERGEGREEGEGKLEGKMREEEEGMKEGEGREERSGIIKFGKHIESTMLSITQHYQKQLPLTRVCT